MSELQTNLDQLDVLFRQLAESLFDYAKPPIILVGSSDEHFDSVQEQFTWAVRMPEAPEKIKGSTALVITNTRENFIKVSKIVYPKTAILAYDETQEIPVVERAGSNTPLTNYLSKVSSTFLRGHVRISLQLQKYNFGTYKGTPLVITSAEKLNPYFSLFALLDEKKRVFVRCPDPSYFEHTFKCLASLTSYSDTVFLSANDYENLDLTLIANNPLVVVCAGDAQYEAVSRKLKSLKQAVCFVFRRSRSPVGTKFDLRLDDHTFCKDEAYLTSYFLSMKGNSTDIKGRTRFIQKGDTESIYGKSKNFSGYVQSVKQALLNDNLKFRNIPPSVHRLSFGRASYSYLMTRMDDAIHEELFKRTNSNAEMAEFLSGTVRSTLLAKLKRALNKL
jgi:hypothetical protein